MENWNVVIRVHEHGFKRAFKQLQGYGAVSSTDYFNVLALTVPDIPRFLEQLRDPETTDPALLSVLSSVIPVTYTFTFQNPEEFEAKACQTVVQWSPQLVGQGFHVRMHRRGFKGKLSSHDEEVALDRVLLNALEAAGTPGHLNFDDPDAIVVVETLGQWCGMACWLRADWQRHPFLQVD